MNRFRSRELTGQRLTLSFEKVGDTYWTDAGLLRQLAAELIRLQVPPDTSIQLKHRVEDDELGPAGWSLNLTVR